MGVTSMLWDNGLREMKTTAGDGNISKNATKRVNRRLLKIGHASVYGSIVGTLGLHTKQFTSALQFHVRHFQHPLPCKDTTMLLYTVHCRPL